MWLIVPFAALVPVGCGTVHNLNPAGETLIKGPGQDEPPKTTRVFGGVRSDWKGMNTLNWNDEYSFLNFVVLPLYVADLPLSLIGDTVTLPYTVGCEIGLFGWRCIYEPTTIPKTLDEPTRTKAPLSRDGSMGNASAPLAGNKFDSWVVSPRIELDAATNR
jgi:uncharacterized protein YceK